MEQYYGIPVEIPTEEEGALKLREVVAASSLAKPLWKEKKESEWIKYPILNQYETNQCTWYTLVKLLGINYYKDEGTFLFFSPSYGYEQRSGWPAYGDSVTSIRNTAKKGVTLEALYPSKVKPNDDVKLTAKPHAIKVAEVFKIDDMLDLSAGDIDQIASTIQATGKGVMVWFWADSKEWKQKKVELKNETISIYNAPIRHSVTAVDFFLINGKKCLLIEDSWGIETGVEGRRIITEDFFNERNYYAGYVTRFTFSEAPVVQKPTTSVKFGDENINVNILQKYLQAKGYFPSNHSTTNYYGNITAQAVLRWQLDNQVDSPESLNELKGRHFGPKSLAKV